MSYKYILYLLVVEAIFSDSPNTKVETKRIKLDVEDWPCLFAPPCTCNYNRKSAYCINKEFKAVPPIINYLKGNWGIYLSHNQISYIPERVFGNVTLTVIDLSYNKIVYIAENAFFGSERSMSAVHLEFNKLKGLPSLIGNFTTISKLHVEGNPIADLNNGDVFRRISGSLDTFSFGSISLQQWPSDLQHLTRVYNLSICYIQFRNLPNNAFYGLEDSLTSLLLMSTELISTPVFLNKLSQLQHLELRNNRHITSDGLLPISFKGLDQLRELIIDGGPIETIPPIFNYLSGLGLFSLSNVPIRVINESVFPANFSSTFYKFVFNNTQIDHFPSPKLWTKVPTLFELAITYNTKITHMTDDDLIGLPDVAFLYLSGNPLMSISEDALRPCTGVVCLYLDNTSLTTIPRAIQTMREVSELDFTNTNITCSCGNLGWMKTLKKTFQFSGNCININMTLKDYIVKEIPKCP